MESGALKKRLELGEDSLTEFKSVVTGGYKIDPGDLAKAIVALANSGGGEVFIGVERDGTPSGVGDVEQADKLMLQIVQACQNNVHPAISCSLEKAGCDGVALLVVKVPGFSPDRPYRANTGVYYVRDANQSRAARNDEVQRLFQSASFRFDEQPVTGATVADLDELKVQEFVAKNFQGPRAAQFAHRHLQALKCAGANGVPTATGVLLFGRDPQWWFSEARVSAVRFPGVATSTSMLDKREIVGTLSRQVEDALAFLNAHLASPAHLEGLGRVEEGIPQAVLREALLNAVVHRDYRASSQIRVFAFDDRVEITNPGTLLNQLTLENIRAGLSQLRNPVLASVLGRMMLRENLGLGIVEMDRLMCDAGLPLPEFALLGGQFRVTLRRLPPAQP